MDRTLRTAAEIDRLRARAHEEAFADAWTALAERADQALEQRLMPPTEGGGWGHHYYCPTHSVPLVFDAAAPGQHLCPVDGENVRGEHMERAWRSRLSDDSLHGALACAQVWLATDDSKHLTHAIAVLMRYTELYPGIVPHGDIVGRGRVHGTALEE